MRPRLARLCALAVALCAAPALHAQPRQAPPARFADVGAYVARTLETFDVPGVAIAVVQDGRVVLARGFGVRRLGEAARVDAHTRFGIASNSKAFTATALGMLVEEGKLEWDVPVVRYLPGFALSDPYITAHLTVRDLLVHRSGLSLGAGDLLWWPATTFTRKEIAQRLRFLPITGRFRDGYAYDNVLYMVAGELVEAVTGQTWEQFVQARIVGPLGMADTRVHISDAAEADDPAANVSGTHGLVGAATAAVPPLTADNTNPAAGINASAADMATWMIAQLDSGRVSGGTRLWQRATTEQLWSVATPIAAQTRVAPGREALRSDFAGYGLGFFLNQYRGLKMVWHTGGLPGYVSRVTMLPDRKIGVAVLTNAESGLAFNALTYRMLDLALGGEVQDWTATFAPLQARQAAAMAEMGEPPAADASAPPTRPLATYAGTYRDPWYGDVVVEPGSDGLRIRFTRTPSLVGALRPCRHDTFVARWDDRTLRGDAFVTFAFDADGRVRDVRMAPVSDAVDFSFDYADLRLAPVR